MSRLETAMGGVPEHPHADAENTAHLSPEELEREEMALALEIEQLKAARSGHAEQVALHTKELADTLLREDAERKAELSRLVSKARAQAREKVRAQTSARLTEKPVAKSVPELGAFAQKYTKKPRTNKKFGSVLAVAGAAALANVGILSHQAASAENENEKKDVKKKEYVMNAPVAPAIDTAKTIHWNDIPKLSKADSSMLTAMTHSETLSEKPVVAAPDTVEKNTSANADTSASAETAVVASHAKKESAREKQVDLKTVKLEPHEKFFVKDTQDFERFRQVISYMESSGNYAPPKSSAGALGKYQIVPKWWFHVIGLNPRSKKDREYFLKNPEVQEKLFEIVAETLLEKHNGDLERTLAEYLGGSNSQYVGTKAGDEISDGGTTLNAYARKGMKLYKKFMQDEAKKVENEMSPGGSGGTEAKLK